MADDGNELPGWVIEKFREYGKLGGRPRTVPHTNLKGCTCITCRKTAKGKPRFGRKNNEETNDTSSTRS
jgi:hypothetical protein